jgi:hypothetical protein
MHYSLNNLYNYLNNEGNVLTGRLQLFTLSRQQLNNLRKCGVTVTTTEVTNSHSVKKTTYKLLGFAQTATNKLDDKSPLFQINSFFRGTPLMTFEFGFNNNSLYGKYEAFGGRIEGYEEFERKEIESIEVRFKNNAEEIDWNASPSFTVIEALVHLNRKLDSYFKNSSPFNVYRSTNPDDSSIAITTKGDITLPKSKLIELIKEGSLNEDLLSYNLTQILVRPGKTKKIEYVLDL